MSLLIDICIVLTGVFVGVLGGLLGFGGSSISTPLLRMIFRIPPYYALASPLPMTLVSASISSMKYHSEGLIDWDVVWRMLPLIIPGSFLGAYATKYIDGRVLMLLTALFLIYVALRFLGSHGGFRIKNVAPWKLWVAGFFTGLLSGMLANGGGILIVPILVLLGLGVKRAIGTSVALVLFSAIPSILVHWYLGHIDWLLTLYLTLGAIPGAYLGAHITVGMRRDKLKRMYGIFLFLFSLYFAIFEILQF